MKDIIKKIRHNHSLMMVLCCAVPLVLLVIAVSFLGLSSSYVFWFLFLLCPLLHYIMMKDMHKNERRH